MDPAEGPSNAEELPANTEGPLTEEEQAVTDAFDTGLLEDTEMPSVGRTSGASPGEAGTSGTSSGIGHKRGAADSGGAGGKRRADAGSEKLPGTAEGQASAPMEGGPRERALPRPTLGLHPQIRHYRKVHRFLSFGIAYDILKFTGSDKQVYNMMTTPLAKIPWDRPYLYLNQAEYSILSEGAHMESVRVTVICRNVRIAFPTNSSDSNLATLNQNKDIVVAQGLNKNVKMVDIKYTGFQAAQPMIPTGIETEKDADHTDLLVDLYGSANFADLIVPRHQAGIPTPLPWYGVVPYTDNTIDEGYPCLQHYYSDVDADSVTGNEIISVEYKPIVGLLNMPHRSVYEGTPTVYSNTLKQRVVIPRGSHQLENHCTTVAYNIDAHDNPSSNTDSLNSAVPVNTNPFTIITPIEKSQYIRQGNFQCPGTQAQDSLHIGLQPVIALTTAALQGKSNSSFTDSQAYFEVICEATVNNSWPSPFPLVGNLVTEHGTTFIAPKKPDWYQSMYNGLYQTRETG